MTRLRSTPGPFRGAASVSDPLDGLYEPDVLDAIDRRSPDGEPPRRMAGAAASTALVTALVTGVKDAVDPEPEEEVVDIDPTTTDGRPAFVTVTLVPGSPTASLAVVRPWLSPVRPV